MQKRIDLNQNQIVRDLRSFGASVCILSSVGKGVPDILVGYDRFNFLFEIKNPEMPPSKQILTSDEKKFHDEWLGSVKIITSSLQAIRFIMSFSD